MYLCIDVGGSKTLLALLDHQGHILHSFRFPTPQDQAYFLNNLSDAIRKHFSAESLDLMLVALPGLVQDGWGRDFGTLPLWPPLPLARILRQQFHCQVILANDADLAGLSETQAYPGRSLYLTFSTGIGGSFYKNGKIPPAFVNFEPGHNHYLWQGQNLAWQDFASARAVRKAYGQNVSAIKDPKIWQEIASRISLGLDPLLFKLSPDRVIFGGPLGLALPKYLPLLQQKLNFTPLPPLLPAKFADLSVIQGAFILAQKTVTSNRQNQPRKTPSPSPKLPSLSELLPALKLAFPELNFTLSHVNAFHPPSTIFYTKSSHPLVLLHEIGHYLLPARTYHSGIDLLTIESAAWDQARLLAQRFSVPLDEDFIDSKLNTYRDWLHQISLCPQCQINGWQDQDGTFHCPSCQRHWHPKEPF